MNSTEPSSALVRYGIRSLGACSAAPLAICKRHAQVAGNAGGERRLAQARRAVEQDVPQRIAPLAGGVDGDLQPGIDLALPDHVAHPLRAQDRDRRRRRASRALLITGSRTRRGPRVESNTGTIRPNIARAGRATGARGVGSVAREHRGSAGWDRGRAIVALLIDRLQQSCTSLNFFFCASTAVDQPPGVAFGVARACARLRTFRRPRRLDVGGGWARRGPPSGRTSAPCGAAWR